MKVDEVRTQTKALLGISVSIEGFLIVLKDEEHDHFNIWLSSAEDMSDNPHIALRIEQHIAELRKIISPMPSLLLIQRGEFIMPPYYYRFPVQLTATLHAEYPTAKEGDKTDNHESNESNDPGDNDETKSKDDAQTTLSLREITELNCYIPYAGKMSELSEVNRYGYSAQVDYTLIEDPANNQPAAATIRSQKALRLTQYDDDTPLALTPDENRYARGIEHQTVTIPGWLRYVEGEKGQSHFVLRTFAVRAGMMDVGPLRKMCGIWWQPAPQYKLVRSHITAEANEPLYNQRVDITGKIAYLRDTSLPFATDNPPTLTFTHIHEIVLHEERYLYIEDESQELGPV